MNTFDLDTKKTIINSNVLCNNSQKQSKVISDAVGRLEFCDIESLSMLEKALYYARVPSELVIASLHSVINRDPHTDPEVRHHHSDSYSVQKNL